LYNILIKISIFLSSGFGVGYFKYAPGTIGTFLGIIIIYILNSFNIYANILSLILVIFFSIVICEIANNYYLESDSKKIVLDEIAGIFVATYSIEITLINIIYIFLLFRSFDIYKPFPISYIDKKFKNGFGIVMDDVLAGVYSNIIFLITSIYLVRIL